MSLDSGTRLGPYEIVAPIGAGGMGEVYRARDTRLGRTVAIKVLPLEFATDARLRTRFEREAKTISSLNHPHICTLHDVGRENGIDFLVLEYCEGTTLADHLAQGPLSIEQTLQYGSEIADALEKAHRQGIVHRDLKPSNIMLTGSGVKLLDFGLAKRHFEILSSATTTLEKPLTQEGKLLGTIQYMAPEVLRGKEADARSDIFALGLVLYEMTTGKPAFAAESKAELIAAILEREPSPIREMQPLAPEELEHLIRRCLAKNPEDRWQSAHDVAEQLKWLRGPRMKTGAVASRRRIALGLGLALLATVAAAIYLKRPSAEQPKPIQALAVLPFVNSDVDSQHLSDGLTEELINRLSQLPDLRVMARTTVFSYKNQPINPRRAGNELKVPAVLVGTLQPNAGRYRIHAELVNVRDGSQIWGDRYDGRAADLVQIQNRILEGVSRRLRPSLTDEQYRQIAQRSTGNPEAYELYLRGLQSASVWTLASLQKAIWYYREAISRDSSFAPAYAGLAEAYSLVDHQQDSAPTIQPTEVYEGAIEAARKALELDGNSVEAHAALGHIFVHQGRFEEAEQHIKRALELNPNSVLARQWYAVLLAALGRAGEAVEQITRTRELDPLSVPLNWVTAHIFLYVAGDLDNAIKASRRVIEIAPDFAQAYYVMAQAYALKGEYAEAEKLVDQGARLRNPRTELDEERALVLALSDRRSEALALLNKITREKEHPSPRWMAFAYSALGENDKAVEWFQRFARESPNYARMASNLPPCPKCAGVRADPRYRTMRRELGLPN